MRRREVLKKIKEAIIAIYGEREARQIAQIVVEEMTNISHTELLLNLDSECEINNIDKIIDELSKGRPMQYVIGQAEFCDMFFNVREGVLIPRFETEELVQYIKKDSPAAKDVLDVGTGSGCIAISLKKYLPNANVTGVDISEQALEIARENSEKLNLEVYFKRGDALNRLSDQFENQFDVVVSNPPYIPASDFASMRINVTKYEPSIALFVEDCDPLIFYRSIARSATKLLRDGGKLYFEIYESFAKEMVEMLQTEGFTNVELKDDINDKPRMICCQKV